MQHITIVDNLTFRQLMESKHYHPEVNLDDLAIWKYQIY
ncbi:hypothetical protein BH23THE1_BH23THE1_30890 [soil metagenome]